MDEQSDVISKSSKDYFLDRRIEFDVFYKLVVKKEYQSLIGLLAFLGGLFKGMSFIFLVILYPLMEISYYNQLIGTMFNVCLNVEDLGRAMYLDSKFGDQTEISGEQVEENRVDGEDFVVVKRNVGRRAKTSLQAIKALILKKIKTENLGAKYQRQNALSPELRASPEKEGQFWVSGGGILSSLNSANRLSSNHSLHFMAPGSGINPVGTSLLSSYLRNGPQKVGSVSNLKNLVSPEQQLQQRKFENLGGCGAGRLSMDKALLDPSLGSINRKVSWRRNSDGADELGAAIFSDSQKSSQKIIKKVKTERKDANKDQPHFFRHKRTLEVNEVKKLSVVEENSVFLSEDIGESQIIENRRKVKRLLTKESQFKFGNDRVHPDKKKESYQPDVVRIKSLSEGSVQRVHPPAINRLCVNPFESGGGGSNQVSGSESSGSSLSEDSVTKNTKKNNENRSKVLSNIEGLRQPDEELKSERNFQRSNKEIQGFDQISMTNHLPVLAINGSFGRQKSFERDKISEKSKDNGVEKINRMVARRRKDAGRDSKESGITQKISKHRLNLNFVQGSNPASTERYLIQQEKPFEARTEPKGNESMSQFAPSRKIKNLNIIRKPVEGDASKLPGSKQSPLKSTNSPERLFVHQRNNTKKKSNFFKEALIKLETAHQQANSTESQNESKEDPKIIKKPVKSLSPQKIIKQANRQKQPKIKEKDKKIEQIDQKRDQKEQRLTLRMTILDFIVMLIPDWIYTSTKKKIFRNGEQMINEKLKIKYMINVMVEFEKLKLLLFDESQNYLFEHIPKPILSDKDVFGLPGARETDHAKSALTFNDLFWRRKSKREKEEDFMLALQKIKDKGEDANIIDRRLIEILGNFAVH